MYERYNGGWVSHSGNWITLIPNKRDCLYAIIIRSKLDFMRPHNLSSLQWPCWLSISHHINTMMYCSCHRLGSWYILYSCCDLLSFANAICNCSLSNNPVLNLRWQFRSGWILSFLMEPRRSSPTHRSVCALVISSITVIVMQEWFRLVYHLCHAFVSLMSVRI